MSQKYISIPLSQKYVSILVSCAKTKTLPKIQPYPKSSVLPKTTILTVVVKMYNFHKHKVFFFFIIFLQKRGIITHAKYNKKTYLKTLQNSTNYILFPFYRTYS